MTEQKLPLLAHIVDPIRGRIHDYETQEQRQLKFQAAMVANMANAVIGIDPGFRVSYCNASAERMYGIRSSEVVGKPLAAISEFSCLSLKLEEALCPKSAAKGLFELLENGSWTGENSELREDGSSFTVSCSLTPLPLEFGPMIVIFAPSSVNAAPAAMKTLAPAVPRVSFMVRELLRLKISCPATIVKAFRAFQSPYIEMS